MLITIDAGSQDPVLVKRNMTMRCRNKINNDLPLIVHRNFRNLTSKYSLNVPRFSKVMLTNIYSGKKQLKDIEILSILLHLRQYFQTKVFLI